MSLLNLLATFTPQERADAEDAIADREAYYPGHKPCGYFGLPLDKAHKLEAALDEIQKESKPE